MNKATEVLDRIDAAMVARGEDPEAWPQYSFAQRTIFIMAAQRYLDVIRKLAAELEDDEPGYIGAEPGDVLGKEGE